MFEIVPIRNRIVVEKIEDDSTTKTGLVLPDDAKERPTRGKVLSVGDGKLTEEGKLLPMIVKAGDTVIFPKYAGHPMKVNGDELLILDEDEILGFLKEGQDNA